MPELPEVETIRKDLEKALRGDRAISLEVFDRRLASLDEEKRWAGRIIGQAWQGFKRQGKYLWAELDGGWRLFFHLRMTGQLIVGPAPSALKPRFLIRFASGRELGFYDQRRFGEISLLGPKDIWRAANPIGPDALELKSDQFIAIVKKRTTRIQPLLMDQRLLAGVGNIYAQEALFKAAIRPTRPGFRVTRQEASRLFTALQETLQSAISHRGSTSRNYRDAYGGEGSAQTLHAVYRKGGKPCPQCKSPLRSIRVGGRGSVFCPQCQK